MNLPNDATGVSLPRFLVDTNILLRLVSLSDSQHAVAVTASGILATSNAYLYIVPQTLYEFWTVATRPLASRGGLGWTPKQADTEISRFEALFDLLPDMPEIYSQWRRWFQHTTSAGWKRMMRVWWLP